MNRSHNLKISEPYKSNAQRKWKMDRLWNSNAIVKCRMRLRRWIPFLRRRHVINNLKNCGLPPYNPRNHGTPKPLRLLVSYERDRRFDWLALAAEENKSDLAMGEIPPYMFRIPYNAYLARYQRPGFKTPDWEKEPELHRAYLRDRKRLRAYLKAVLKTLVELYRPDAILSASNADAQWIETIRVAKEMGIPWAVAEREGVIAPLVLEKNVAIVKKLFDPESQLFFASNPQHKRYWERIGLKGGSIVLTGELKSDFWSHPERWPKREGIDPQLRSDKLLILYFAFGSKNYIDERFFPNESRDWSYLQEAHCQILGNLANRYKDRIQVVVKTGHAFDMISEDNWRRLAPQTDNLITIGETGQAIELIANADIVIGLQSTAVIESMFMDIPIIYGGWGEFHDEIVDQLLPIPQSGGVEVPQSAEAFENHLIELIENPESRKISQEMKTKRQAFREQYFYKPDGQVGARMLEHIQRFVAERHDQSSHAASEPLR